MEGGQTCPGDQQFNRVYSNMFKTLTAFLWNNPFERLFEKQDLMYTQ